MRLPLETNYNCFVFHLALLNILSPWVGSGADSKPRIVFPKPESSMPHAGQGHPCVQGAVERQREIAPALHEMIGSADQGGFT